MTILSLVQNIVKTSTWTLGVQTFLSRSHQVFELNLYTTYFPNQQNFEAIATCKPGVFIDLGDLIILIVYCFNFDIGIDITKNSIKEL